MSKDQSDRYRKPSTRSLSLDGMDVVEGMCLIDVLAIEIIKTDRPFDTAKDVYGRARDMMDARRDILGPDCETPITDLQDESEEPIDQGSKPSKDMPIGKTFKDQQSGMLLIVRKPARGSVCRGCYYDDKRPCVNRYNACAAEARHDRKYVIFVPVEPTDQGPKFDRKFVPVGDTFRDISGRMTMTVVEAVSDDRCIGCYASNAYHCSTFPLCSGKAREDSKNVIFVPGEPEPEAEEAPAEKEVDDIPTEPRQQPAGSCRVCKDCIYSVGIVTTGETRLRCLHQDNRNHGNTGCYEFGICRTANMDGQCSRYVCRADLTPPKRVDDQTAAEVIPTEPKQPAIGQRFYSSDGVLLETTENVLPGLCNKCYYYPPTGKHNCAFIACMLDKRQDSMSVHFLPVDTAAEKEDDGESPVGSIRTCDTCNHSIYLMIAKKPSQRCLHPNHRDNNLTGGWEFNACGEANPDGQCSLHQRQTDYYPTQENYKPRLNHNQ